MRQAGRYMPEYRALRARHSLLEICRHPELAAEVTITAAEYLNVDAAIIFADLLLPVAPLGLRLEFAAGEGPVIDPPVRSPAQVERLAENWGGELGFVAEAIGLVARHFAGRLPVIGFAGSPFTLASYLIEGGSSRHYLHTKRLMHDHPRAWQRLMAKLSGGLGELIAQQIAAGAGAIQLFDSWVGTLSEQDFRTHVLPYVQPLVRQIEQAGVPAIYFSTGTGGYLPAVAETGASVLSLDWRSELAAAWRQLEGHPHPPALQGNLDPVLMLCHARAWQAAARRLLEQARGRPGYIFNLGHGILPETDPEAVRALVAFVHEQSI